MSDAEGAKIRRERYLAASAAEYEALEYARTAGLSFSDLEELAFAAGQRLAKLLLESRLEGDPRAEPDGDYCCPRCQGKLRIQERQQARTMRTMVGEVSYRRPYGVCDRCQITAVALDQGLGIPPTGSSVSYRQKVCHAAIVGRSFDDGQELLRVQAGLSISAKHVRTIAEAEGRRVIEQRDIQLCAFEEHRFVPQSQEAPELCVVTCDGGRVQTRQPVKGERWKEDKIGVVYDAIPQPLAQVTSEKYEGAKALTKTYVATMEPWERLGWMLRLQAELRGYEKSKAKIFLADGAPTLRELKNFHFPEATFILDWPHAAGHLMECAKAIFGEGTVEAYRWYDKHTDLLWEGDVQSVIAELEEQSQTLGLPTKNDTDCSARRVLYRNATSYFPNNRDAMDYPTFRAKGWPIASGVAEGAVKQFALRIKGSEKFWHLQGAEEILTLCALYHSEDGAWQRHWKSRGQPRSNPTDNADDH
ncbi:MAG: ISKra4 family transposase [Thermoanaerobaculia bacterium]